MVAFSPTTSLSPFGRSPFALRVLDSVPIMLRSRVELFPGCMILLSAAPHEDCPDDTDKCGRSNEPNQ